MSRVLDSKIKIYKDFSRVKTDWILVSNPAFTLFDNFLSKDIFTSAGLIIVILEYNMYYM